MKVHRPRVVIIGAGFGGLAAAKALADAPVDVILIDRQNHHLFQPLLYQVATAGLNPSDIAQPIRHILAKQLNCQPVLAEVVDVDTDAQFVATSAGPIPYDFLVLAAGATHAYFGNDAWAQHAPGLKTIEDALDIRRRILLAFEKAELVESGAERERLMTFAVVGAGPTGVEMAGAIREIATESLRSDFRRIDTEASKVLLIEAGPAVLPPFPEKLQRSAARQLEQLGVDIRTNTRVTAISEAGVTTDAGFVPAATVVWAAGVAASPLGARVAIETDRSGRAVVQTDLSLAEHPNIFAIGDMASATDDRGRPVPGVAPAAEQGGIHVARCIEADLAGVQRPIFSYKDKGSMATIGRSKAVANLGPRLQFGGRVAWVLWGAVHIWSIVEFRSRLRTMSSWNWQYWTGHRGARLITGNSPHAPADETHHGRLCDDHPMSAEQSSFISAADGTEIATYAWTNVDGDPRGAVQIAHGLAEHGERYDRFATALNQAGFLAFATDHRGHGRTGGDQLGDFRSAGFDGLIADIAQYGGLIAADHPGLSLFLLGHSMGSFASQAVIVDGAAPYTGVILSGSSALDVLAAGMAAPAEPAEAEQPEGLTAFNAGFEHRTGYEWLSRDASEVDTYVADPWCGFDVPAETLLSLFAPAARLADPAVLATIRSELPLLVTSGTADPLAGGGELIELLGQRYRDAGVTDVTVTLYPEARHEILNETNLTEVTTDIIDWLTAHATG